MESGPVPAAQQLWGWNGSPPLPVLVSSQVQNLLRSGWIKKDQVSPLCALDAAITDMITDSGKAL